MFGELVLFLHISFMFAGVAAADGMGWLAFHVARSRDVAAMRTTYRLMKPAGIASTMFFLLGLVFGVLSIFTLGFDPTEPWLLIAYALFVTQVVLGIFFVDRWHGRVGELANAEGADPNTGELAALLNDGTAQTVAYVQTFLVLVFIFDMVVKPFS